MEILIPMRQVLFLLLFCLGSFTKGLQAQSDFSDMLTCMLESSHWEDFYCTGVNGKLIVSGIVTQNKIPLYTKLFYKGEPVEMNIRAPKSQRHLIFIKQIAYTQDFTKIKVLYDQRVRAKFKLGRGEEGENGL